MKYLPLVWAGLLRKPLRSIFTLLSIIVAFVLFGLLQGLNAGFDKAIADQHLDLLVTDPLVRGGEPLPMSARALIENVPGVIRVAQRAFLAVYFQQPKNGIPILACDLANFFAVRPALAIPKSDLNAVLQTRHGMIATPALQKLFGWTIGEQIPFKSQVARQDGSTDWTFELVGTLDSVENPNTAYLAMINYDYYDSERAANRGMVERFYVQIADPNRSVETAKAIDRLFANSSHETRTQSDKDRAQSRIKQVGDIGFFTKAIVDAVFFTLLFLTANTMRQSIRDRIPEFGVLKAMGFSDAAVLALVLIEALLLCTLAAILGLAIAAAIAPLFKDAIGAIRMSGSVIVSGLGIAIAVALASAALPAWRVKQLRVVDALSGR